MRFPAAALLLLSGCGFDALFLTPRGFDATDPPTPVVVGQTRAGAVVRVLSKNGALVAETVAGDGGAFEARLPAEEDGRNLRLIAELGGFTAKAVIPSARPGEFTDIGPVDAYSTAAAQLATFEVLEQAGSSFQATPPTALAGLLQSFAAEPTPELQGLIDLVAEILGAGAGAPPFDLETSRLAPEFVAGAGLGEDLGERYRGLLSAAAEHYGLVIRCDPSRLNVMFTVDASGRGRDGNNAPQLIRQPTKEGRIYLGFTADESSAISDDAIPNRLTPNDPRFAMNDEGDNGDETAGDGIYTVVVPLPRGARLIYKYTNGAAGEGFTGTEEWPGNARIIQIEDVLTGRPDGEPDCLVIRRDSFGDEATNKNFVNINARAKQRGGTVGFDTDLGGAELPVGPNGLVVGGLYGPDLREQAPFTPAGVPEARENGICTVCPAPLILDPDDRTPPVLLSAERLSVDRVRARFSEPLNAEDAQAIDHFQYLDDAGRSVEILAARPSGADVLLFVEPTHPRNPASLRARSLRDASVQGNMLDTAEVAVAPDETPPRLLGVRSMSILELQEDAVPEDPTVGDLVELTFDERPEESAAADPTRYRIDGLQVLAASVVDDQAVAESQTYRVRLVTETQVKGLTYALAVSGVRDLAGNALDQETTFEGFALYRVTFGVVPGFAFASSDGALRGLPRDEKLYLTGTAIAAARDLDGRDISITRQGSNRTDVTGWPQFEMTPSGETYEGQEIYTKTVLLPKGSWAWKAAHGVEGEHARPPTTLEKVYKTLATRNDATGVRVDPVTMTAANGVSYQGARLSESGDEPPRRDVVFKREAPDEVCEVARDGTVCPFIVVGTWRDLVLDQGGRTRDYDDGIITLEPHRPTLPDFTPPKLLDARARDSYSILLSFDEAIAAPEVNLDVSVARADDGFGVPVRVLGTTEVKPHQAVIAVAATDCEDALLPGTAYTVRYRGATNDDGLVERSFRSQTVLAPDTCVPLTPLTDTEPPAVEAVEATDLTELTVRFDERIDPATTVPEAFSIVRPATGGGLAVNAVEVLPDRASVRLVTDGQRILEPYRLMIAGLADAADPPNVLTSTTIDFIGFGELVPPEVERARAIDPTRVVVRFNEAVEPISAMDPERYAIDGLTIEEVAFAGDPGRRSLAFNPALAPRIRDVVVLTTSPMTAGQSYTLTVDGVRDLSGNPGQASLPLTGVAEAPKIDVILEYEISDGTRIAGQVPSRAIGPAELMDSREGVFILGARATPDHTPVAGVTPPVNDALGGFGVEGQPLDGIEPRLIDTGAGADSVQGDGVFTILVPQVPLGTTMIWKAFAPFTTGYRDRNPQDSLAAFADPLPGPSVFADGQEYPGNENGAVILDDGDGDGRVRIRCLFGDEVTYKKNTGNAAFVWVAEDTSYR